MRGLGRGWLHPACVPRRQRARLITSIPMRATLKAALADRLIMGMPMSMRHMQGISQAVHTAMLVIAGASH